MTDSNVTKELEKKLLSFITEEDPMLCMLQWITEKFMEIEVANKVGAQKGEHSPDRTTHLSGSRVRTIRYPDGYDVSDHSRNYAKVGIYPSL